MRVLLLEEIHDNVQQLPESMSGLSGKVGSMNDRLGKVEENTKPIPSIKVAVIDQSRELSDHEHRINSLERTNI